MSSMNIPDADIDDFLAKVQATTDVVKGLAEGTLDPKTVKLPGESKEEEKIRLEQEADRARRRFMNEQQREADRVASLKEERIRWWEHFEMTHGDKFAAAEDEDASAVPALKPKPKTSLDYSFWDKYVQNPDDPVTVEEKAAKEAEEEEKKNEMFEANNPEFVKQFKEDMKERNAASKRRAKNSADLRQRGNKLYKDGHLRQAEDRYHEALRLTPWDLAVLTNLAQVHFSREDWPETLEFCKRALSLDPAHAKSLYKKGLVLMHLHRPAEAVEALQLAAEQNPGAKSVRKQLAKARAAAEEAAVLAGLAPAEEGAESAPAAAASDEQAGSSGSGSGSGSAEVGSGVEVEVVGDEGAVESKAAGAVESKGEDTPAPTATPSKTAAASATDVALAAAGKAFPELAAAARALCDGEAASQLAEEEVNSHLAHLIGWDSSSTQGQAYVLARSTGLLAALCAALQRGRSACSEGEDGERGDGDEYGEESGVKADDVFTQPRVQQNTILALMNLADNEHNEHFLRTSGALRVIMAITQDHRTLYLPAVAAAYACLERLASSTESAKQFMSANTNLLTAMVALLQILTRALKGSSALQPLQVEAASAATLLLQKLVQLPGCAKVITAHAELSSSLPMALFGLVDGVVRRCAAVGGVMLAGRGVAETLLGSDMMMGAAGALANLAHYPQFRPLFVRSLSEGEDYPALTPLVDLLKLKVKAAAGAAQGDVVSVKGSTLAALANAGLDCEEVLDALCRADAVATLLKLLKSKATPSVLLDRASALLARLASHSTVQTYMQHPKVLARMVKVFCSPQCSTPMFIRHLLRCIAAGMHAPAQALIVAKEGGLARLLEVLQDTLNAGEVRDSPVMLASLTRCLIVAAKQPECLEQMLKLDATMPILEVVKLAKVQTVRRNAAIALAQIARSPEGKERLRELNGMKVLIQLGGELGV